MNDELRGEAETLVRHRRIAQQRLRCLKAAKLTCLGAAAGVAYLCLRGMQPAAVTVPLVLAVLSLLCAAGSAALFAHIAGVYLGSPDQDADEDGGSPGGGSAEPPEPLGGGGLEIDWVRFESEFGAYCERLSAVG